MNEVVQPWAPTDTLLLNTLLPSSAIAVGRPPEITQKKTGDETTTHTRTHARMHAREKVRGLSLTDRQVEKYHHRNVVRLVAFLADIRAMIAVSSSNGAAVAVEGASMTRRRDAAAATGAESQGWEEGFVCRTTDVGGDTTKV
jgi:hypothetical protein